MTSPSTSRSRTPSSSASLPPSHWTSGIRTLRAPAPRRPRSDVQSVLWSIHERDAGGVTLEVRAAPESSLSAVGRPESPDWAGSGGCADGGTGAGRWERSTRPLRPTARTRGRRDANLLLATAHVCFGSDADRQTQLGCKVHSTRTGLRSLSGATTGSIAAAFRQPRFCSAVSILGPEWRPDIHLAVRGKDPL